jgi:hypothetical protein
MPPRPMGPQPWSFSPATFRAQSYGPSIVDTLSDTWDGTPLDAESRGWSFFGESLVVTQTIANGELDLEIGAGGAGGAFWFDRNDGMLLHKEITGPFDARQRCRIRNTANNANPPVTQFRIAGLAVHNPDRTGGIYNYLHIGAGSTNAAGNSVEWKTTDDDGGASADVSAFSFVNWGTDPLDIDLRIIRRASDLQVFDLLWRPTAGDLLSSDDWNALITVDRADNTTPDRNGNGAGADLAVELPDTVQVGPTIYAQGITHDIRMQVLESRFII